MSSSSGSPIGNEPKDPFEKYYRVEELEAMRDLDEKASQKQGRGGSDKPFLVAYLLLMFRKILDLLGPERTDALPSALEGEVRKNLLTVKAILQTLEREDRSQDAPFLNQLSTAWQKMLEHSLLFRVATPLAIRFKVLIKDIASYPEKQEHSLAYYLTEYAGHKWLPFPYMELVHQLHARHLRDPKSPLARWISMIDEIIVLLRPE
jgi:hypothetical protein